MDLGLPSFGAFVEAGIILMAVCAIVILLAYVRALIRDRFFLKKDYFGDKISVKWRDVVKEGERSLTHSIHHWRCNYCGQKKLAQIEYQDGWPRVVSKASSQTMTGNLVDVVCGACGVLYNASLYAAEVKVLRGCTDPITELKRPATHTEIRDMFPNGIGAENRINVCKTCKGSQFVKVPEGNHSAPMVKVRCPDCYRADDSGPPMGKSARRRAIEHTRAKVSAEEADRLKEPREDIISQM